VTALAGHLTGTAVTEASGDQPGPGISVRTIQSASNRTVAMLHTMRFTVRAEHDLMAHATMFGLETVADCSTGHLSGISADQLCIGSANQDAMAQFSATGFVAAAVTAFEMHSAAMISKQHEVREFAATYDRPFGFAAVHRPSGLVVVAGWVADPEFV
jgi:serine protease inhibitor